MTLSSDELEILEYLKSWNGASISMLEICRCAGGRRKFRETPHWAKGLMSRLVEGKLVEANERGHYCIPVEKKPEPQETPKPAMAKPLVGDNYFPAGETSKVIGEDYFPASVEPGPETQTRRWISPQIEQILRQAGKKLDGQSGVGS